MDIIYHYPPELLDLLVDTIQLLSKSKTGVIDFLRGAGVEERDLADLSAQVRTDRTKIYKAQIVRTVLTRLNERGESTLRERREIIKRVVEFEDFSSCWDEDRLPAKGLVAQVRKVVNVKDAFTRINQEREAERKKAAAKSEARTRKKQEKRKEIEEAKRNFFHLFAEEDPHKRGRLLEPAISQLFKVAGIRVREPFHVVDPEGGGIVEQVDGALELQSRFFLTEIKWLNKNLPKADATEHIMRVFFRTDVHGLFVSATPFSSGALAVCREGLQKGRVIVLCTLDELVRVLEAQADIKTYLEAKVNAVIASKNPYPQISI